MFSKYQNKIYCYPLNIVLIAPILISVGKLIILDIMEGRRHRRKPKYSHFFLGHSFSLPSKKNQRENPDF